jgi:hypothetical protein
MRSRLVLIGFSCLLIAACGGSALDPGAGDDPGTGTSTLAVNGEIEARPRVVNARDTGDFDTHLSVRVELNGQLVTTGTVTVTSRNAMTPLSFHGDNGKWDAVAAGYDEVYQLDVESGEHLVQGVRVDGPDIHAFTAPLTGATLDSTIATRIDWSAEQEATSATIDADEIDRIAIPDTGTYMLAAGALKADRETARPNTIELVRMNRVTPAGAAGGSELSVSVENHIDVVVQPNPLL